MAARSLDHPLSVGAGILTMVLGSLSFPLLPLIVGALSDHTSLSARDVGWVASADMSGMFLAAVFALFWIRRVDWRHVAFGSSLLLVVCHAASSQADGLGALLWMRAFAGFFGGSLMALGSTAVADTTRPERNIALLTAVQLGIASVGFWILPSVIQAHGVAGVFLALALVASPALALVPWLPRRGRWPRPDAAPLTGQRLSASTIGLALLATLPGFLFHLGYGASWAYMERIGVSAGLASQSVGRALSISLLAGVLGSLVAWRLGMRFGRRIPLALTLALQLASLAALAFGPPRFAWYLVAVLAYAFCLNFPIPYHIGLAVRIDRTGRAAVLYLLMLKAGIAVAPVLASRLVADGDFAGPLLIAAVFYTLCFVNLMLASSWLRR